MTNMYLNEIDRRRSRMGCFVVIGVALLLVVGGMWLMLSQRGEGQEPDVDAEAAEVESLLQPDAPRTHTGAAPSSTAVRPPVPATDEGQALLAQAREARARDDFQTVRELGWRILAESQNETAKREAEQLLGEVHTLLVMSPRPMPEKVEYTIQRGDTLGVLARRFGTTVDLIQKGNRLTGHTIRIGDRLRILQATFSLEVSKTQNDLILFINDRFFKRYQVGTGEYQRTPVGEFKVTDRIAQPTWWRPDGKAIPYGTTNNVLGTHWLSIDVPGYGIHGTWEPESIGHQSSAGCVRMLNSDIEELYTLLPVGARVVIVE